MANYTYSSELLDAILDEAGELTDGTSDFESAALKFLNKVYQAIWLGGQELDPDVNEEWWWLRAEAVLNLSPREAVTVAVTNQSTTVTLSASIAASRAGWKLKITGHDEVYTVSAHTAGTTGITLDAAYVRTTNGAVSAYLFKLDYTLATDVLYLTSPFRGYRDGRFEVEAISEKTMQERWPLALIESGVPQNFCFIGEQQVRFSHQGMTGSTDLLRLEYSYIKKPADLTDSGSEEPLVPREYRRIMVNWGVAMLLTQKNDNRAEMYFAMTKGGLQAMAVDNRRKATIPTREFGTLLPRQAAIAKARGPKRTASGLIIG